MSDKLSDCPFCGNEAETEKIEEGCYGVGCGYCDFQLMSGNVGIGWHESEAAAIGAWNRRASPAPAIRSHTRAWIEKLIDCFDVDDVKYIGPDDASCYVNALREMLDARAAPAISESEPTVAMIDAARPFFLGRECGCATIEGMRKHFDLSGIDISALPAWFREGAGHLTKAGQAIIVWHLMDAARKGEKS